MSLPVVPLSCRVSRPLFSFWYALRCVSFLPFLFLLCLLHITLSGVPYSTAIMASPFKFTVYLMEPLSFSVSFMTCLPPAAFFHAVSPFLPYIPAVSLAHFSLSGEPYSTATMAFLSKALFTQ
jgi:hypothetical protein